MSGYIGQQPVAHATQTRDAFTATAAQTSFATSGYTPGYLDVYLNGVKLAAADYTATNSSDVVLAVGAALNDILEIVAYSTFETFNETFTGTTTVDILAVTGTVDGRDVAVDGAKLDLINQGVATTDSPTFAALDVASDLGVNTTVGASLAALGGAVAIGDTDTGIAQNGDGVLEVWANGANRLKVEPTLVTVTTPLKASSDIEITGNIYGPDNVSGIVTYGGTDGLGAYTQLFGGAHTIAPDETINYSSRFRVNRLSDSATLLDVNGTAGTAFIKGQTTLGPHNTEGGELVWQTAAGATGYTIDVDASGNLRIRDTTSVKILITAAGGIQLPGALEGTTRPAATAIGDIWVDTTDPANGTLKKRLT